MKKRTIAVVILAGGIVTSLTISGVFTTSPQPSETLSLSSGENRDPAFKFNAVPPSSETGAEINRTDFVAQRYGEEILKLNAPGTGAAEIIFPPEGTVESLIEEAVRKPFSFKTYSPKDLRHIPLEGKEGLARYFVLLAAVQAKHFKSLDDPLLTAIAKFVSAGDSKPLEANRIAITAYLGDLLAIPVPAPLVPFHINLMNLWQKRVTLAAHILEGDEDPIRLAAAVDALALTADEETNILETLASDLKKLTL